MQKSTVMWICNFSSISVSLGCGLRRKYSRSLLLSVLFHQPSVEQLASAPYIHPTINNYSQKKRPKNCELKPVKQRQVTISSFSWLSQVFPYSNRKLTNMNRKHKEKYLPDWEHYVSLLQLGSWRKVWLYCPSWPIIQDSLALVF